MFPILSGLFIKGDNGWVVLAHKTISVPLNPNKTWHIHCFMTRLHRGNNDLLAQELVSGQQTS